MKKVLIIMAGVLVAMAAGAYMNELTGFRGRAWGSPLPQGWGFPTARVGLFGGIDFYHDPGEYNTHATVRGGKWLKVELAEVEYGFWQGKLESVKITVEGYENFRDLLAALNAEFGHGVPDNEFLKRCDGTDCNEKRFYWAGSMMTMLLRYIEINHVTVLFIRSRAMMDKENEWEKSQAKKGAS